MGAMNHTLQRYQPRSEARRLAVAVAVGIAVALAVATITPWEATVLIGWDAAALVMLVWIWTQVRGLDADATRTVAVHEDDSRTSTRLLVMTASVLSLAGVGVSLWSSRTQSGHDSLTVAVFGVGTVLLSWALIHTLFMLRYAHLYYDDEPGGITFAGSTEAPDYLDFAYLAFTVGMTFQVSDTTIDQRRVRRTVLRQALLSYLFGVVIVAMTINLVATLIA
jgi:uncharacterized membrane protein